MSERPPREELYATYTAGLSGVVNEASLWPDYWDEHPDTQVKVINSLFFDGTHINVELGKNAQSFVFHYSSPNRSSQNLLLEEAVEYLLAEAEPIWFRTDYWAGGFREAFSHPLGEFLIQKEREKRGKERLFNAF